MYRRLTTPIVVLSLLFAGTTPAAPAARAASAPASAPAVVALPGISAGRSHSCAKRTDGTVICWGSSWYGESKRDTRTFTFVSAGGYHNCGLLNDGTIGCWGLNGSGQATPPAGTFLDVSAGDFNTCAIKSDQTLACWGVNDDGQSTPPAGTYTDVAAGIYHACAVAVGGALACWGDNALNRATPPAGTYREVGTGWSHGCALTTTGSIACWGDNTYGQATPPAGTYTALSVGYDHNCAMKSDSTLACWGTNDRGRSTPPSAAFTAFDLGGSHSCGITGGEVVCWGNNANGQSTPPFPTTTRYSGAGRFQTAADISAHTFSANCYCIAYIAYAYNFPDALAGAAAAGEFQGPVLLVDSTGPVNSATAAELTRLQPYRIVVLGSTSVISAEVAAALDAYSPGNVERYFGANRFATAAAVSAHTFNAGCGCTAYIAYAYNFPDALAGAAAAGRWAGPVLLVNSTGPINSATAAELTRLQPGHIVVLGSTTVISSEVEAALDAYAPGHVDRYYGATRFETAAQISVNTFPANCGCVAYIAYAYNFPDALAGAAAAGEIRGPVLLVNTTGAINSATAAELTRLQPYRIIVLGSAGVISADVLNALKAYAPADWN
jgi:putative cell wall-binding protein